MYNEPEKIKLTIIGVGATGLAVIDILYQWPLHDTHLIIGHTDADALRASPVPDKFLFDADQTYEDAAWYLTDSLRSMEPDAEIALIVTDLSTPADCLLTLLLVQTLKKWDMFTIATVGLVDPASLEQQERTTHTLLELQQRADSLWAYPLEQEENDKCVEELADALIRMIRFGESLDGSVDFPDVKKVVGNARMAVATATGQGANRAIDAADSLISQIRTQTADGPVIDHILLLMGSGSQKPLTLREHTAISGSISDFVGREVRIFKCGCVEDTSLGEAISVALLIGMPLGKQNADQ